MLVRTMILYFLGVATIGCNFMSANQLKETQQNIDRMREAQSSLLKNPHDDRALAVILDLMKDKNGINRSNAAAILEEIGKRVGADIKDKAIPALIQLLQSPDIFDRKSAASALRKFGPNAKQAIPTLRQNLRPRDSDISWYSVEALGEIGEAASEAVPDLIELIKEGQNDYTDEEEDTFKYAVLSLGKIGPAAKAAVPDLEALLDHENPYSRIYAAVSLIGIDPKNQKALSVLRALMKAPDTNIRQKTIWTLESIGTAASPAKEIIKTALADNDETVRSFAIRILQLLNAN